jgi:hypothetical protein
MRMMSRPCNVDPEGFVRQFARFGEHPSVERYVDLFAPAGTVQHPGMARPLAGREIRDFISAVLLSMPDFELRPLRWCSRGDVAFVEAQSSGSVGDKHASWAAIYRVQLTGSQVLRGRSFYDRADVFAQLQRGEEPGYSPSAESIAAASVVVRGAAETDIEEGVSRRYADAWLNPDPEQIVNFFSAAGSALAPGTQRLTGDALVYHREKLFDEGTLRQRCQDYATGRGCAFFQWELAGTIDDRPFSVLAAERLLLDGPKIAESRIYFDTLAFEGLRDPSVASRTIFDAADDRGEAPQSNPKEGRDDALL